MNNIFLISDTHFGHSNFLNFTDEAGNKIRPFNSVEEMDELMIENWNKVVDPQDKVYHLGDVCFSFKVLEKVMPRLNGTKVLIKGNHDNLKLSQYAQFFKDVRGSHQLDKFVLTHIPLHIDCIARWCHGNIHGHTHEKGVSGELYHNICVEKINYTPIAFEELKSRIS